MQRRWPRPAPARRPKRELESDEVAKSEATAESEDDDEETEDDVALTPAAIEKRFQNYGTGGVQFLCREKYTRTWAWHMEQRRKRIIVLNKRFGDVAIQ